MARYYGVEWRLIVCLYICGSVRVFRIFGHRHRVNPKRSKTNWRQLNEKGHLEIGITERDEADEKMIQWSIGFETSKVETPFPFVSLLWLITIIITTTCFVICKLSPWYQLSVINNHNYGNLRPWTTVICSTKPCR